MRVVIDTIDTYSGGYLTYLKGLLSSKSIPSGISVIVCCSRKFKKDIGNVDNVVEFLVDKKISSSRIKMYFWRRNILPRILKDLKADIHFNPGGQLIKNYNHNVPAVSVCLNLLPFSKKIRNSYPFFSKERFYLAALAYSQSKTFQQADGVIFLNDYVLEVVRKYGVKIKKAIIIPFGMSDIFRGQPILKRFPINPRILYVSPFQFYKNQWNVAEAVDILRKNTGIDLRLQFVGGDERLGTSRYEKMMCNLGYPKWIERIKSVSFHQMPKIYRKSDIFVFASSIENMPNILMEAMAVGLPIACSNIRPMTDILGDAGVYFNPFSPETIANAIQTLIKNPELRVNLAIKAQKRVSIFSWKKTVEATFDFLRLVAGVKDRSKI